MEPLATSSEQKDMNRRAPHVATGGVVEQFGDEAARALYLAFQQFNAEHWGSKLAAPLVLITNAASTRTLGDYIARDIHGLESRIRIAPAAIKRGMVFALDVLLHEMVHAWQAEIAGNGEDGYRGHGPLFAAECNRIGATLGLPPVGVRKRKKGSDDLPLCNYWPMNVRPEGYYPEPFQPPTRQNDGGEPEEGTADEDAAPADRAAALLAGLCSLDTDTLRRIHEGIADELVAREGGE